MLRALKYLTTLADVRSVSNTLNTQALSTERRRVLELHEAGLTPREMSKVLDLSIQRIYQQLSKLEVKPNSPKEEAS